MVVDMEQPCMQGERSAEKTTVALRSHVFAAHPQLGLGGCASREVVFISSAKAASVRRILHEDRLVAALRRTAAALSPPWSLTVLEPSALSYLDELSLLGGARVVIALFSSALHSCRFLAPGTTVIELHGALRDEYTDPGAEAEPSGLYVACHSRAFGPHVGTALATRATTTCARRRSACVTLACAHPTRCRVARSSATRPSTRTGSRSGGTSASSTCAHLRLEPSPSRVQ